MKTLKSTIVILAAMLTLAFGADAGANSNGGGNSPYAPGQNSAHVHCDDVKARQESMGILAGGGPKSWFGEAPTNCDHYYSY